LLKVLPPGPLGPPGDPLRPPQRCDGQIVRLPLNRIKQRVDARYKIRFEYTDDVVKLVVSRCTESESRGCMIDAIQTNTMLPDISREFLNRMLQRTSAIVAKAGAYEGLFWSEFAKS
jgi:type VI secretion system protein VasG